MIKLN